MTRAVEESALSRREEFSTELAPNYSAAAIEAEIQAAITIAIKFPRNEDQAFAKLMRACKRTSFAEDAAYSFPRGDTNVTGPSVNLAREAARVWGNIRYGVDVIRDDDESRQIRGWAWDLETNTKTSAEDDFKKLIYRRKGGWQKPDERDLRELTNRRAAILIRNCILSILPKDLIEDALDESKLTIKSGVEQDPEAARKKVILGFSELNITPQMLEQYLEHPIGEASPAEIANLRAIYKSIADGHSKWTEYVSQEPDGNGKANGKTPSGPARITDEQLTALNKLRAESGCPGEKMAQILKAAGFSVMAHVTVDKYDQVADAVSKWNAGAPEDKPDIAKEDSKPDIREQQRAQIQELVEALVATEVFTQNQAMDIVEQVGGSRSLAAVPDANLPNLKIRLEGELKKARRKK